MSRKSLLVSMLFIVLSSFAAYAAENVTGWNYLLEADDSIFYSKNGSWKESEDVISIIYQEVPVPNSKYTKVNYGRFTLPSQACKDEMGQITVYELSGKVAGKYDYVKGGLTVAAYIGDMVCLVKNTKKR